MFELCMALTATFGDRNSVIVKHFEFVLYTEGIESSTTVSERIRREFVPSSARSLDGCSEMKG